LLFVKNLLLRARAAPGLAVMALLGLSNAGLAQSLPSEPIVFGGGRVTLSGDVSATYACTSADTGTRGCADDAGFFNYTDYEHSALRMLRFDINTSVRATDRLSVLADIRSENGNGPRPYGLYVRLHPWAGRDIDIQAGRIPPTFGAFARRPYANDNLLIGYPLAYQYLTSLRPDALPANADELLRMRARGWLSNFSLGNPSAHYGMSIASAFRWDTGVQVHAATRLVEGAASVTTGSLGNPLFSDDNSGKQIAARVAVRPTAGLILGASASRSPFVERATLRVLPAAAQSGSFTQTAWGADAEYSRDYYLVRAEAIVSDWTVPLVGTPGIDLPLRAASASLEGRYKLHPRFSLAARVDHLGFSTIHGTSRSDEWDAPVSRVEIGGAYSLQRNVQIKLSVQRNVRDGGRVRRATIGAAQVVYWF
jgi:hypothetical protein